jgi:hypothetical protein
MPGMSGGASGIDGTSGTDSGTWYSATIAPTNVPEGQATETATDRAAPTGNQRQDGGVLGAMRPLHRVAALAATIALLGEAPAPSAPSEEAARLFAMSGTRTAAVQSYTSRLHVDVALRSFPYLKFHLNGTITFKRPNLYSVHFEHVPWFGKGFEDMKMDPMVPSTWGEHYDVTSLTRTGDRTHIEMRDKVDGHIKGVHAELDADGLRKIEWSYLNGGNIGVAVTPVVVSGIPVPATEDADIHLPAYHVICHATFSDYKIVTDSPYAAGGGR